MNGTVKWYNVRNGYGFIAGEDGKDYFVHHTQVPEGAKLFEDTKVTFEAAETEKGLQARNIQMSEGGEAPVKEAAESTAEAPVEEPSDAASPEPADAPAEEASEELAEEDPAEEESDAEDEEKKE